MDRNQNITLDFSVNKSIEGLTAGQELAIMPASLAKRLLEAYAVNLSRASARGIIQEHVEVLQSVSTVDEAIEASLTWVAERDLINNIIAKNWDAYRVEIPNP